MNKVELQERLNHLRSELKSTTLVAVTKYSPVNDVEMAYECGQLDFGENRVADLEEKAGFFNQKNHNLVRWHFIGHLQSNKVKDLLKIPHLWAIHSVDSLKILEEIHKRENDFAGTELKLFFQVKTSGEEEKSGFDSTEELIEAINFLLSLKKTKLKCFGLMTMGAIRTDHFEESALKSFRALKNIRSVVEEKLALKDLKLSMGMSQDYQLALSEGADFIRVGSLIFK